MMYGHEKSDLAIVMMKPPDTIGQNRATGGGAGGAKGGSREERETAKHAPGSGPGKRETGVGSRTASRKAKEEGKVHCAPPPYRTADAADIDGLTWRKYEASLDRRVDDLHNRLRRGAYRAQPSRRHPLVRICAGGAR